MSVAEWHSTLFQFVGLVLSLLALIGSFVAIYFTYRNLKEMQKQLKEQKDQYFEQNRGNLIFYILKTETSVLHSLVIKNFGNSPAKLISLELTPDLDWNRTEHTGIGIANISTVKNVFLAPQQHIASQFDFRSFEPREFQVKICYETCGKTITEEYCIDTNFMRQVITLEPHIGDELSALKCINKSLTTLANKFI